MSKNSREELTWILAGSIVWNYFPSISGARLHPPAFEFLIALVRVMQSRLFPDAQPLVEKLGREFFRQLPETPGVYLMRDRAAQVLYVGKAKNLRQRVCSYRVANPERMARRTLRLLRLVENIGWEECGDEPTALRRESELLLRLKPRFNRAGVWQGPKRFLAWRCTAVNAELAVTENPEDGWQTFSALGGKASWLHGALVRLIWFMTHPDFGVASMPVGWADGRMGRLATIPLRTRRAEVFHALTTLQSGEVQAFCDCLRARMSGDLHPFLKSAVESDLESIAPSEKGAIYAALPLTAAAFASA